MLTAAQLTTLGTNIAANAAVIPAGQPFAGSAVKDIPHSPDGAFTVAWWYNQPASVAFFGNYSTVPVTDILNAITWKNFTPTDAVPTTPDLTVQVWMARNSMCQTLQMNIQNLVLGRTIIDATKGKIVSGFQDSLSTVPSGTAGAAKDAGWASVQKILCRKGTNAEKLFADTTGGAGDSNTTAATFTFEGLVADSDVKAIWGI